MTMRTIAVAFGALLLTACSLSVEGLGPDPVDDAGSRTLEPVDGAVVPPARPSPAPTTDARPSPMDAPAPMDAPSEAKGGGTSSADGSAPEGGSDPCQSKCTDPKKPVCCPGSSGTVTCSATSDEC